MMTASGTDDQLGQPLPLGSAHIASNRLSLAAMTNNQSFADGTVSGLEVDWLASRAHSGFGTVVTSGLAVSPEGRSWVGQACLYDDRFSEGLERLASARDDDTIMIAQLFHGGLRSPRSLIGRRPLGPSSSSSVQRLSLDEVERVLDDYAAGAERATRAGFDGVEIHAAHGYLPAQFLSRIENTRTDSWGGGIDGRSRFVLRLVERIRDVLPSEAFVQLRLSAEDVRQSRGIDLDETVEVANRAVGLGADAISLSVWDVRLPSHKYPDRTPAAHVREHLRGSAPLAVAGAIWTADDAAFALAEGADQLAVGRMAIFNPDAVAGLRDPRWQPRRPPFTPEQFASVGVSPAFLEYLRGKWPEYVVRTPESDR